MHPDLSGSFTSKGHNLVGNGTGSSDVGDATDQGGTGASPINPMLGPLAHNGGPTATRALLPNSPALDVSPCISVPGTDQRGWLRPDWGGACDTGTFERGARVPVYLPTLLKNPHHATHLP